MNKMKLLKNSKIRLHHRYDFVSRTSEKTKYWKIVSGLPSFVDEKKLALLETI